MEKLKVILIAVLIWAAIIWFARTMKQKSDERLKKIEERMPEMEPVTEEEREYICENMIDFTTGRNVFLWVLILFNLWMTIVCAWKTVTTGISGEVDSIGERDSSFREDPGTARTGMEPDFKPDSTEETIFSENVVDALCSLVYFAFVGRWDRVSFVG